MEAGGSFYCFVARGRRARRNERRSEMSKHDQREAGARQTGCKRFHSSPSEKNATPESGTLCGALLAFLPACLVLAWWQVGVRCWLLDAAWSAAQIIIYNLKATATLRLQLRQQTQSILTRDDGDLLREMGPA